MIFGVSTFRVFLALFGLLGLFGFVAFRIFLHFSDFSGSAVRFGFFAFLDFSFIFLPFQCFARAGFDWALADPIVERSF